MKYMMIALLLIFLVGCGLLPEAEPTVLDGVPKVKTIQEAADWVYDNVTYTSDWKQYGFMDYWASPEQTLKLLKGDCEDYGILFLYIVKTRFDIEGTLEVVYYPQVEVGHAYGKVDDIFCYRIPVYTEKKIKTYSYGETMAMVGLCF
jgi:hypothetical protein